MFAQQLFWNTYCSLLPCVNMPVNTEVKTEGEFSLYCLTPKKRLLRPVKENDEESQWDLRKIGCKDMAVEVCLSVE